MHIDCSNVIVLSFIYTVAGIMFGMALRTVCVVYVNRYVPISITDFITLLDNMCS